MELPLHFRYQPPSSESPYKTVAIPIPPMAFVLTNRLPKQFQQESTIGLLCNTSSADYQSCSWTRVQVGTEKEKEGLELSADIPRGLQAHTAMVVGVTVFATLMATAYIAYAFMSMKERTEEREKSQ